MVHHELCFHPSFLHRDFADVDIASISSYSRSLFPFRPSFVHIFFFAFIHRFHGKHAKRRKELSLPNLVLWISIFVLVIDVIAASLIVYDKKKEAMKRGISFAFSAGALLNFEIAI